MKALSVKQVAEKLSLSRTTIYRMVAAGVLPKPFFVFGNRTAWLEEDIDAWLAKPAGKVTPNASPNLLSPAHNPAESRTQVTVAPRPDKPTIDTEAILSRLDTLITLLSRPQLELRDRLWSIEEISEWMLLPASAVKQRVISQPGFPRPFRPGGSAHSQSRWFAGEVIKWAHEHRGKLPLRISKGSQTPPLNG
ncbi:helix-turn-helix domain-containing protein [Pandoraea anhela]|uniref:Helix-turn-helix domain-containing protein n=1 Tax=Pandoraea anhela TaxID=2508295 RepID=A0A5E4YZ19_9BURK|nr:AlpA family phage regulatory protein [Pandoraea anhela]VVE53330.1 hypothetical protein PAN31108_04850 [Pandoraea anhela]